MFDEHRRTMHTGFLFVNNLQQHVTETVSSARYARYRFPGFIIDQRGWETLSGERGEKFGPASEIISPTEISVDGKEFQ